MTPTEAHDLIAKAYRAGRDGNGVYCEVCGKPIENIKNATKFLGWCRMQKVKAAHHECRHGQRKTLFTMPNNYRRESDAERIARFMAQAEAEYDKSAAVCSVCGRTLNEWGRCPTGCLDNRTSQAIISAYSKPAPQYQPVTRCPECFCEIGHCEHSAPIEGMNAEHIRNGKA